MVTATLGEGTGVVERRVRSSQVVGDRGRCTDLILEKSGIVDRGALPVRIRPRYRVDVGPCGRAVQVQCPRGQIVDVRAADRQRAIERRFRSGYGSAAPRQFPFTVNAPVPCSVPVLSVKSASISEVAPRERVPPEITNDSLLSNARTD